RYPDQPVRAARRPVPFWRAVQRPVARCAVAPLPAARLDVMDGYRLRAGRSSICGQGLLLWMEDCRAMPAKPATVGGPVMAPGNPVWRPLRLVSRIWNSGYRPALIATAAAVVMAWGYL